MNHAEGGSGLEPVPVSRLRDPSHVILTETVVGGVSVHHTVHPDDGRVEHGVLGGHGFFDFVNKQHISVVVLFQKLKGQTLFNLAAQD